MRRKTGLLLGAGLAACLGGCNPEDAGSLARDTQQLAKTTGTALGNAGLQSKVVAKLSATKGVSMKGLHIETKDRVVTVSGHVRNAAERKRVVAEIEETSGVDKVIDKLRIQSE
jgi:hyperosmotically inducible protein